MKMPTTAEAQHNSAIAPRRLPWPDAAYAAATLMLIAAAVVLTGRFEPLRVGVRPLPNWIEAFQLQSLIGLGGAMVLFWSSRFESSRARGWAGVACIAGVVLAMLALPLDQPIRMGDSGTYTSSRQNFDFYMGGRTVRFEAHLSSMLLRGLDRVLGGTESSPREAFTSLMRAAAVWFGAMLLLVGWAGRWSPSTLRYQSLVVGAPATLMYFGYRELGYLSLNAAVVPLVFQGFRGRRVWFDLGCAAAGLGAALHGFGLLSLAGTALATLGARLRVAHRARLLIQAFAIGTSAYLIWMFLYVTVLRLDIVPGHAESIPWRPLFDNAAGEGRINYAIASARGAIDVLLSAWITGLPLVVGALAALRRRPDVAVPVLLYALPSALFLCLFWPVQGLAVEADLLFAACPGFFALAWMASRTARATIWSLLFLASAHVIFWRVMLSDLFVNSRVY
jgi:hypothetical protein